MHSSFHDHDDDDDDGDDEVCARSTRDVVLRCFPTWAPTGIDEEGDDACGVESTVGLYNR